MTTTLEEIKTDYKVRDIGLADFGRKEIDIAEKEMPGLMATRDKYGHEQPLSGVKGMGSRLIIIRTAVLLEPLVVAGAGWGGCAGWRRAAWGGEGTPGAPRPAGSAGMTFMSPDDG